MKLAIPSSGTDLSAPVDRSFGRCAHFVIHDTETGRTTAVDNQQNLNLAQGAGIQSAQTVAGQDVDLVLAAHCGPKAFATLTAADIRVALGAAGTVGDAVDAWRQGRLSPAADANVEGHWA